MTGWWESYGLNFDPFFIHKPLSIRDTDFFVSRPSLEQLLQYFPSDEVPTSAVILVHGAFGSGKTTTLKFLENYWGLQAGLKADMFQANIGVTSYETFEINTLKQIYEILSETLLTQEISTIELIKRMKKLEPQFHSIILIDEIHKVQEEIVVRFLRTHQSTFEFLKDLPVTIFFTGNDSLANKNIGAGGIRGIFDRYVSLDPLTESEVVELIDRRLRLATKPDNDFRNPFNRESVKRIRQVTEGIPRSIVEFVDHVMEESASDSQPITIDELSVAKAEGDISGAIFTGILNVINSPHYIPTGRRLEKLFSFNIEQDKIHDYLLVINSIYLYFKNPANIEDLQEKCDVLGSLDRTLTELCRNGILLKSMVSKRGKLGTTQIPHYALDANASNFFEYIFDKYRVTPANYLVSIFQTRTKTTVVEFSTERNLRSLERVIEGSKDSLATGFLKRSREIYTEILSSRLSSTSMLLQTGDLFDNLLKAYNAITRHESGKDSDERLNNFVADLSASADKHLSTEFVEYFKVLVKLKSVIEENSNLVDKGEMDKSISKADRYVGWFLGRFPSKRRSIEKIDKKSGIESNDILSKLGSLEESIGDLKRIINEGTLRIQKDQSELQSEARSFLLDRVKGLSFLMSSKQKELLDAFLTQLERADQAISEHLKKNNESLILRAFTSSISKRIDVMSNKTVDPIQRKEAIVLMVNAFEEFCRYVAYFTISDSLKAKLTNKETNLSAILCPVLGKDFRSRYHKYNEGKLADLSDDSISKIDINISSILNKTDKELNSLGQGATDLILLSLIRNFEQHTMRNKNLTDPRFCEIYDSMVSGFIWFYEYLAQNHYLEGKTVALYNGRKPARLIPPPKYDKVITTNPVDIPVGSFLIGQIIFQGPVGGIVVVSPFLDKNGKNQYFFDLFKLPHDIDSESLPLFHSACLGLTDRPLENLDVELLIVPLKWFEPRKINTTYFKKRPAYFDEALDSGRLAVKREYDKFYAIVYQTDVKGDRFPLLIPIRFFTCLEEVVSFVRAFPLPYGDLNWHDQDILNKVLRPRV